MEALASAGRRALVAPLTWMDRSRCRQDKPWLAVLLWVTAAEFAWWAIVRGLGFAPSPFLGTHIVLAFAAVGIALGLRALFWPRGETAEWPTILIATVSVGAGASLFLPIKYAIPHLVGFWLDVPLAHFERTAFGDDPWHILDGLFGSAAVAIDTIYALWLPAQTLALAALIIQPPSQAKSRALIAYVLSWFLLGVIAATLLSSAGPIFHDRVFGGNAFRALADMLHSRGAWLVLAESDRMWASLASDRPGIIAGISAVPSVHVAISVWMVLVARTMVPRAAPFALVYAAFIWIASVQLGWHYVTDGLAGALGVVPIWVASGAIERFFAARGGSGDRVRNRGGA